MAAVSHRALAAALLADFGDRLAGDLCRAFKLPGAEVAGGQAAGFVQDVDQDGCAKGIQAAALLGQAVFLDGFGQFLAALLEEVLVGNIHAGPARVINDHGFDAARTHHCAHAAAPGIAPGSVFGIIDRDAGVGEFHLPCLADADDGCLGIFLPQQFIDFVHALAHQVGGILELDAVLGDDQGVPLSLRRAFLQR